MLKGAKLKNCTIFCIFINPKAGTISSPDSQLLYLILLKRRKNVKMTEEEAPVTRALKSLQKS